MFDSRDIHESCLQSWAGLLLALNRLSHKSVVVSVIMIQDQILSMIISALVFGFEAELSQDWQMYSTTISAQDLTNVPIDTA